MSSKILRAFKALDAGGKSLVDYHIKFIEPKRFDEAILQLKTHLIPYEKMSRSINLSDNPIAVEDFASIWRKLLERENVSIGCFQNGILVGANILTVKRKSDEEETHRVRSLF